MFVFDYYYYYYYCWVDMMIPMIITSPLLIVIITVMMVLYNGWYEWTCTEDYSLIEGSLESETSDNMDSWKAEVRRVRRDKIRRKKMQMREKVGKSRNTVFFQWFVLRWVEK